MNTTRAVLRVLVLGLAFLGASVACDGALERTANAQSVEAAPFVTVSLLRYAASAELERMLGRLPTDVRRALIGAYVAFDDSPTDPSSMSGCDDDGDYVVVVSDALLRLAGFVAEAEATDEAYGTHEVDDYATFLAEAEGAKVRPVPPPPGFFEPSRARLAPNADRGRRGERSERWPGDGAEGLRLGLRALRFREIVAAIVAHELVHFVQGDLACPNPTATHERGDDQWTREEREQALDVASRVYTPERVRAADAAATMLLLDEGLTETGSLAWLRTMERLERQARATGLSRQLPVPAASTYLLLHTEEAVRVEVVRAAAAEWRILRALQ
jgi:hypothetical protein